MITEPAQDNNKHTLSQSGKRWVLGDVFRQTLSTPVVQAASGSGLLLLLAIQHFHLSAFEKSLHAIAFPIGMLLAPVLVGLAGSKQWAGQKVMALSSVITAVALLSNCFWENSTWYLYSILCGIISLGTFYPFVTNGWQSHVHASVRGKWFSITRSIGSLSTIGITALIAWFLGDSTDGYQIVLFLLAGLLCICAAILWRQPHLTVSSNGNNILRQISLLWRYPIFGYISFSWYLLGLSNLSTIPLRNEYLAGSAHGLEYAPNLILVILVIIPTVFELLSALVWGRLFDRMNFIILRQSINVFFALSIGLFFLPSIEMQILGSVLFGCARGGGSVAWSLWVTKFAPPNRTADYMAVHTFLTGTRGIIGPLIAFQMIEIFSMQAVTLSCVGLTVFATLLLIPIIKVGKNLPAS